MFPLTSVITVPPEIVLCTELPVPPANALVVLAPLVIVELGNITDEPEVEVDDSVL